MKILKGLLYFVLILLVVVLIANAFAPAEKNVERSVTIDAPLDHVYSQVADFDRWMYWDPWYNIDTSQVRETFGEKGYDGYGYTWKSESKDVGNGSMKITAYDGKNRFDYHLEFEGMGGSDGYFSFEEAEGKTNVTWVFTSKPGFMTRFFNYIIDGQLGPDLEKGLQNLKELVENSSPEELGLKPETRVAMASAHGTNYALIRKNISISKDMESFFGTAYDEIFSYIQGNGITPTGPARALYYTWEPEKDSSDCAAAVPISDINTEAGTEVKIAVGKAKLHPNYIVYTMVGPYSGFEAAHEALGAWVEKNEKELVMPVVEEYIKSPNDEVDSTEYVSNIYYYFK